MKFGAAIPVANEWRLMPAVIGQLQKVCERVVLLRGRTSLSGQSLQLGPVPGWVKDVEIVEGDWGSEHATRNAGMDALSDCDYVFTVDSDEVLSDRALQVLRAGCVEKNPRALLGGCHTYWKTVEWRIDPPEKIVAPLVVRKDVRFNRLRMFNGESTVINQYVFHHLSYARTDEEMQTKLRNFGHSHEVVPGWYERVWKRWDADHALEDLHPTHPAAFKRAVPVDDGGALKAILSGYGL